MDKKYISFDIEASGKTPGKYSMLSIGACIVGETDVQFYREIKPLNGNFIPEAMKIGALGLRCLDDYKHIPEYNPRHPNFSPAKVLEMLAKVGEEPTRVMSDYADWIRKNTKGFRPIEAAAPIKFDGMFSTWYFDNFYEGENPFGHSGEDMSSFCRGVMQDENYNIKALGLKDERSVPHNALEDAIQQAKAFEKVLSLIKSK